MTLFDFFNKRLTIDFSDDNIERLTKLSDELGETLMKVNLGFYVDFLAQIRLAAERHDTEDFKKKVISRELFGGAGALWEIWIEDKQLQTKFNKQFCDYVDLLKKMGIKNGRVNQVRKVFNLLDKN